jgi:hypothetical protein
MKIDKKIGPDCIPKLVKLSPSPIRVTTANEKPILRIILSYKSIPRSVFFAGNIAKINKYPGMKIINGKPKIIRKNSSVFNRTEGSKTKPHNKQTTTSSGYLLNVIFIL